MVIYYNDPAAVAAARLLYNPAMATSRADGRAAAEEPVLTRDFVVLFIASFFFMGSLYLLIPVLPLYMHDVAGASITQVGLLVGVMTLVSFLLRPYVGVRADRSGRKPFLVLGSAIFVVAPLLYCVARTVWALPLVLALSGVGVAFFHTSSLTFIGDTAPISKRGRSQAWFQTSFNLSIMLAPPLGVLLMDRLGYNAVFVASSIAGALSLVLILFVREQWIPVAFGAPAAAPPGGTGKLIALVSVAIFASTTTLGAIQAFLGLFTESAGIPGFALFFTISGTALISARFVAGKLVDAASRRVVTLFALASLSAAMFVLAASRGLPMLSASAVLWGLGFAYCSPALSAMMMDRVPPQALGKAFGIYTSAFEGGIVFGAMAMGPVVSVWGYRPAFAVTGAVCILGAIFFAVFYRALTT